MLYATEIDSGLRLNIRPYVFQFSDYFESTTGQFILQDDNNEIASEVRDKISGGTLQKIYPGTISNVQTFSEDGKAFISNFDLELRVKDSALTLINDYDLCMQRASRPICTIEEYMDFMNPAPQRPFAGQTTEIKQEFGIEYPLVIRSYVTPDNIETEYNLGASYFRPAALEITGGVQLPELRRDWDTILLKYRNKVKENSILGN
jgi:hypothetical protein